MTRPLHLPAKLAVAGLGLLALQGCVAVAAVRTAGAVVGTTAEVAVKVTGAVVETGADVVLPDGQREERIEEPNDR
jgi:hypothetical protein